jgi:MFS family permease
MKGCCGFHQTVYPMVTVSSNLPVNSYRTHLWTTVALCVCMLTHSYLLISVFPYSGFLVIHLLQVKNEDDAAKYAGLIASAFMVGRATTSVLWGHAADRYGRSFALYASLLLSAVFSFLFGLTRSFVAAMIIRFLLGCANGIVSTVKTMVSDMHSNDIKVESRVMNLVMGMWGWGFLISPVVSGILAEPAKQYSDKSFLLEGTLVGTLLRKYPFFLPNLLGALSCLIGMVLAYVFVHETLPVNRRHSFLTDLRIILLPCQKYLPKFSYRYESVPTMKSALSDVMEEEDEENLEESSSCQVVVECDNRRPSMREILSQKDTRDCVFLLWGYSFVGLAIDEAFPLFCLSHTAGFGILEKDIGKVMSLTGLLFALSQYFVAHFTYTYCGGLTGSTKVGAAFSAPTMFLVPISLLINHGSASLQWPTFLFLAIVLSIHRSFSMVFFSNIAVAMNRTVTTANRGAMNGVAGLGASVAKALGPTFAGVLTTLSIKWFHEYASILIFGTLGVFGIAITFGTIVSMPNFATNDNSQQDEERKDDANSIELKENLKNET